MITRIQTILNKEELSASKFAEKIGVQRSSISHILSERNKPSLEFIQKIIENFENINPEWIITGKGGYTKKDLYTTTNPQPEKPTKQPIHKTAPQVQEHTIANSLFSEIKKPDYSPQKKETTKIVTFYTDGTFDEHFPNKN